MKRLMLSLCIAGILLQAQSVEEHIARGTAYFEKGEHDKGLTEFRKAVALSPTSAKAHYYLAAALAGDSKLTEAAAEFRRSLAIDPKYAAAWTNLGSVLAKSGDVKGALDPYRRALAIEPGNLAYRMNLAMASRAAGDANGAIGHLKIVAERQPRSAAVLLELGLALRQNGEIEPAVKAFESAIEIDPELREGYYNLGLSLKQLRQPARTVSEGYRQAREVFLRGDLGAAATALRQALAANEDDADAHNLLGFVLGQERDLTGAVEHLNRAVALRPDFAEARYNLGVALWYSTQRSAALENLRQAVKLDPAAGESCAFLGMALRESGDLSAAREQLQRAIALLPLMAAPLVDLGIVYVRLGDDAHSLGQFDAGLNLTEAAGPAPNWEMAANELRAKLPAHTADAAFHNTFGRILGRAAAGATAVAAEFREAIKLQPDFAEAQNNLGLVLTQTGDDEGAAQAFREAERLSPKWAEPTANLGALLTANDPAAAIRELDRALALEPESVKAQYNLALAYGVSSTHGINAEMEQLRKVIRAAPEFSGARLALGKALLQKGSVAEGVENLRAAVRLDPASGEAHYQLGLGLERLGQHDDARREIQQSRELIMADDRSRLAALDLSEGKTALDRGDSELAAAKFRHALALEPQSGAANRLGLALAKSGDLADSPDFIASIEGKIRGKEFAEAQRSLSSYLQTRPDSSWAWYALGYAQFAQKEIGASIQSLAKSLGLNVKNAEAHKILGRDLMIIGRFDGARTEFEQGIGLQPESAELHYNLGKLHSINDNWPAANKELEEAVRLDSSYVEAWDALGFAKEALGDDAAAISHYQKAIELNKVRKGGFSSSHVNLSALYNRTGRSELAMQYAKGGLELDAKADGAWFQLAKANEKLGNLPAAVDAAKRAIELNGHTSAYYYVLAALYRRQGKVEESHEALEQFRRLDQESRELDKKRRDIGTVRP
jgi:tetratricopeptide (TPR) repeat protein